jgi:hypothetical protein
MGCAGEALDLAGCQCMSGEAPRPCYVGDPARAGKGACVMGSQSCAQNGGGELGSWTWGTCIGSGMPAAETCGNGVDDDCDGTIDNACGCKDGDQKSCVIAGQMGTQTCVSQVWAPCDIGGCPGIMAGQPCNMVGTSIPVMPNSCNCPDQGTSVTSLFCDNMLVWSCFPADDCSPAACTTCLQQHCGQYMSSPDPACEASLTLAINWLEACGPDRNEWFIGLGSSCAGGEVEALNSCKFQFCVMNGTCSYY